MQNVTVGLHCTVLIQGVISDGQFIIVAGFFSVAWFVLSALGTAGNVINLMTFITMKLEDGVTLSFLVLTVSDLCFTLTMFLRGTSSLFYTVEMASSYHIWFPIEPYAMYIFFINCGIVFYAMTVLTTTFLAVARCMCVARPLHFKNAFTRSRCVIILICFAVFSIVSYLPIFFNMGVFYQYDPRINASRPLLWISGNREFVKDVIWGARDTFLQITTQFVVIFCVIVMARSLSQTNIFRQSFRATSAHENTFSLSNKNSNKLTRKDQQVVKQVALISVVFIVCNMPTIVFNIAGTIQEDLTIDTKLHNIYLLNLTLVKFFQIFNSSINVFIYYRYNSKFRNCCPIGNTWLCRSQQM